MNAQLVPAGLSEPHTVRRFQHLAIDVSQHPSRSTAPASCLLNKSPGSFFLAPSHKPPLTMKPE